MLIKPIYFVVSFCLFAACGLTIAGLATGEWIVRSYSQVPTGNLFTLGLDRVSISERMGINGWLTVRFFYQGALGSDSTIAPWGVSFDVDTDCWLDGCQINGYTQAPSYAAGNILNIPASGLIASLPDFSTGLCNRTALGGLSGTCDTFKTQLDLLNSNTAVPQAIKDIEDWKYRARCPLGKATISFWTASAFFFLVAAIVAILPAIERTTVTPLLVMLFVCWVFTIVAFSIGVAIVGEAKRVGLCDLNNYANKLLGISSFSFCSIGFSFLLTLGGFIGLIVATAVGIAGMIFDRQPVITRSVPLGNLVNIGNGVEVVKTVHPELLNNASPNTVFNDNNNNNNNIVGNATNRSTGSVAANLSQQFNQVSDNMQNEAKTAAAAVAIPAETQSQFTNLPQAQAANRSPSQFANLAQNSLATIPKQVQDQRQQAQNPPSNPQNPRLYDSLEHEFPNYENSYQNQFHNLRDGEEYPYLPPSSDVPPSRAVGQFAEMRTPERYTPSLDNQFGGLSRGQNQFGSLKNQLGQVGTRVAQL